MTADVIQLVGGNGTYAVDETVFGGTIDAASEAVSESVTNMTFDIRGDASRVVSEVSGRVRLAVIAMGEE